jgi:hypothetical protein
MKTAKAEFWVTEETKSSFQLTKWQQKNAADYPRLYFVNAALQ